MEAWDEKPLPNIIPQLFKLHLIIIDQLDFVTRPRTGAELFFEVFSKG